MEEEYVPVLKEVPVWYQWHLKGSTVPKKVPFKTALSVHLDKHIMKKKKYRLTVGDVTFLDVGMEDLHPIRFFFSSMIIFKDSSACLKIQPRQIISLLKNALYFT